MHYLRTVNISNMFFFLLQETEKLVVFLFGVMSHQTADVLWHSLGIDQGFLSTMAKV